MIFEYENIRVPFLKFKSSQARIGKFCGTLVPWIVLEKYCFDLGSVLFGGSLHCIIWEKRKGQIEQKWKPSSKKMRSLRRKYISVMYYIPWIVQERGTLMQRISLHFSQDSPTVGKSTSRTISGEHPTFSDSNSEYNLVPHVDRPTRNILVMTL